MYVHICMYIAEVCELKTKGSKLLNEINMSYNLINKKARYDNKE